MILLNLLPAINLSCLSGWGTFQLNPQLLVDISCGFGWGVPHFIGHVILLDGDVIMTNYLFLILNAPPPLLDCRVELLPGSVTGFFGNTWPWGGSALDQHIHISISDSAFSINVIGRRHFTMKGKILYFRLISVFIYVMLFCSVVFSVFRSGLKIFFSLFIFLFSFISYYSIIILTNFI